MVRLRVNNHFADTLCLGIVLGYAAYILLRWILIESHSFFGDEAFFIFNVKSSIEQLRNSRSVYEFFLQLYFNDPLYPSIFTIIAIPFYLLFENHIVGLRFMISIFYFIYMYIFYQILKRVISPLGALSGSIFVMISVYWIKASHYYLRDSLVGFEIVLLLFLEIIYLEKKNNYKLLLIGLFCAIIFLTKFSASIYVPPLVLPLLIYEYKSSSIREMFRKISIISLPTLFFSAPWYISMLTNDTNILDLYSYNETSIRYPDTDILTYLSEYLITINTTKYTMYIFLIFSILYILKSIYYYYNKNFLRTELNSDICYKYDINHVNEFIAVSILSFIIFSTFCLLYVGRLWVDRWNFSPILIIIFICWMMGKIRYGSIAFTIIMLPLIVSGFLATNFNILNPYFGLRYNSDYTNILKPETSSSNSKLLLKTIEDDFKHLSESKYIATLILHDSILMNNSVMQAEMMLIKNAHGKWIYAHDLLRHVPKNPFLFFESAQCTQGAKTFYFVTDGARLSTSGLSIYQDLLECFPENFWKQVVHVADIPGRNKMLMRLYRINIPSFDRRSFADMAKAAALVDSEFSDIHRLREIRYGLEYGTRSKEEAARILGLTTIARIDASLIERFPDIAADIQKIIELAPGLGADIVSSDRVIYEPHEFFKLRNLTKTEQESLFCADNNDPMFYVSIPDNMSLKPLQIVVKLEAPQDATQAQIFYRKNGKRETEDTSIRMPLLSGENTVIFNIPEHSVEKFLRIDPGDISGEYRIKSVEITAQ
jgi:4-amino-4-deoxy-L-arabinose transferase-like glycosyltransferase